MTGLNTVFIDATAVPGDFGGVGRYVDGLIDGLAGNGASGSNPDGIRLVIAAQARHAEHFATLAPSATIVAVHRMLESRPLRLLWEQFVLPVLVEHSGATVLHSPHYTFPLWRRGPVAVTLHDATFFSHPELHATVKRRFFRAWTRLALQGERVCIVPSRATDTELRRYIPGIRAEIRVAYHGVDPTVFHEPTNGAISLAREAIGLEDGQNWIAFLGTIEPRKNLGNLIRAHAALRARRPDIPDLAVIGARGWDADALGLLDARPPATGVHEVGYLPIGLLAGALGGASLVVYPSLGEGFGLPVLEAMACGACVLTTRRLALPEVGGDAVAYSDVDADSLERAIGALLDDAQARRRLGVAAQARAAGFSWEASASAHRAAYEVACSLRSSKASKPHA